MHIEKRAVQVKPLWPHLVLSITHCITKPARDQRVLYMIGGMISFTSDACLQS